MNEYEHNIRIECLRIATGTFHAETADDQVRIARTFSDFVLGKRDAEVFAAAKKLSDAVTSLVP